MSIGPDSPATEGIRWLGKRFRSEVLPILSRLPAYGRLIYALVTEPSLPNADRTALLLAIGYQVSPVDLIPGFLPVIGQLDDLLVMLWGVRRAMAGVSVERADELLAGAGLTRAQIDADTQVVRGTLQRIGTGGTQAVSRGLRHVLKSGVRGGAFLGYFAYYLATGKRAKKE